MDNNKINIIEINMAGIKKDLEYIKGSLTENKKEHLMILNTLKEWKTEAESRYASRWVETLTRYIIGIVVASIIGALMMLIIKQHI